MRKRKVALLLAAAMVFTSAPVGSITGFAEDVIAEDMIMDEIPGEPEILSEAPAEDIVLSEESDVIAEAETTPEAAVPENIIPEDAAAEEAPPEDTEPALTEGDLLDGSGFIESVEAVDYFADGDLTDADVQPGDGASFETAATLTTAEEKTAVIENPGDSYYFKFTAPQAGLYSFYSNATRDGDDTKATLFDENYAELAENDDDIFFNGWDFRIVYQLEAGKTYYLNAYFLNSSDTGSFSVGAECFSLDIMSGDSMEVTAEPASLKFFQYTASQSDTYVFSANIEDILPRVFVLDDSMNNILISGNGSIRCYVTAGETYYFAILYPDVSEFSHTITVTQPRWFLNTIYDNDISIQWGETITLEPDIVINDESVSLTYKWEKYNYQSDEYEEIASAKQYTTGLTGEYRCTITDVSGERVYYHAYVYVDTGFRVEDSDIRDLSLPAGAVANLEVKASTVYGTLSYAWYVFWYDGQYGHAELIPDASGPVATVTIPADAQNLEYQCFVSDGCNYSHVWFSVEIINCTHQWTTVIDQAPTCAAAGSQHLECAICHEKQAPVSIPATGNHSFGGYVLTVSPTALSAGVNTRTCTVCGAAENVSVAPLAPTITLNASKLVLKTKQSTTKLKVSGLAAGDYVTSWKSSNTKIVTVNSKGRITAKAKTGKATITITLASGLQKNIPVTVQKATVTTSKITGISKKLTLAKGKKSTLEPVITPITSTDKVTYKTSNKKVATVSSKGVITAKASGTAKITVTSGKKKAVITVTVPKTKTTSISGVPATLSVKKGKTYKLKAKLNPKNSEEKLTYSTSNKKVATVDKNGKITGKKAGKATITVKSGNVKVKCVVTVK